MRYIIAMVLLSLIILSGCGQKETKPTLSELQITACNSADEGKTCDSKLPELGIVTQEECCRSLDKCC